MNDFLRELARLLAGAQLAIPDKQRTGTADTGRPSEESRRAPITPDTPLARG